MARRVNQKAVKKKKKPTAEVLSLQSTALREARKLALLILCCGLPAYLYVLSVPEKKKLDELEAELKNVKREEKVALQANDRISREISAYKSNPEYLEIIARDHLNLYKEGERVIRIER